ncbi:carbohydrate kinase family protein [Thermospira aquatica]|uniref:Carbohydrate kinase family protein n=1 Tax=Thermospira aquatica TaxID=2828656 RepID=A0AAX3BFE7_9SPIR|nr:carbohydrate kinase family protein [Thermospira aquatica]URA11077.1 carbohydrate kinase family protein [Thermospira aquatica]
MLSTVAMIGTVGIDTNIYLYGRDVDFSVEMNFSQNRDCIGQAGGYGAKLFSSLGLKTKCIAAVGDDPLGQWIRQELAQDGIECLFLSDPEGTHRSVNLMYPDGRRKNFYDARGSMDIRPDETTCRLFLQGVRLAHFSIENWCRYLLPVARSLGMVVSVDIQDVVDPFDSYRQDFIREADVLFFSAVNHENVTDLLYHFAEGGKRIVICGRGAKGCAMIKDNTIIELPAVDWFGPLIDTNGAGDALAVGFCVQYFLQGDDAETALWKAQLLARHVCTLKTTASGFLSRQELEAAFAMWAQQHLTFS